MEYSLLKYFHILGAVLMGAGLIGVWLADLRSRQLGDLARFSEAVRYIVVFYDGVVVPGAIILLISGVWFTIQFYGGWDFLEIPWLAGMIALFSFEFIEGNTVTRLYFTKLRRITNEALAAGKITRELVQERAKLIPTFTHCLDIPVLFLIIALGALKPESWDVFLYGVIISISIAVLFTIIVPRLYPWGDGARENS